jgi:amino-acid N-acetyltransferase
MTSLGASPSGEIFNVNTEHLASYVAGALKASKVVFFTVHGSAFIENQNKKLVQNLRVSDARNVLKYNNVTVNNSKGFSSFDHDEDLPPESKEAFVKLGWCVASLDLGVKRAHIISPINGALLQELYTRDGSGTLISRDIYEGIRVANVGDVAGIYDLIEPLVTAGTLVPRPKNVLENDINSYYVFTRDNLIVACAQIKLFEMGYAEIGCLVVKKEYRAQGRGDAMLGYLERLSVQVGCTNVFVLSTQTMEWFIERGFKEVPVNALPPTRQAVYNHRRKSKIYMKTIQSERELDSSELWWNR